MELEDIDETRLVLDSHHTYRAGDAGEARMVLTPDRKTASQQVEKVSGALHLVKPLSGSTVQVRTFYPLFETSSQGTLRPELSAKWKLESSESDSWLATP
jgi:hypothetical protein